MGEGFQAPETPTRFLIRAKMVRSLSLSLSLSLLSLSRYFSVAALITGNYSRGDSLSLSLSLSHM
jgi:hypothetical protein